MKLPYLDAHCDTLSRCLHSGESLLKNSGQCDLERLGKYEPSGQIFAIFADSARLSPADRFPECRRQAELFARCKDAWPEQMRRAVLSIEGAELLDCDPGKLETVRSWGVRCVNLTWNHANTLSGSHREEPERGLSPLGVDFARRAWELGLLPDVSHLSDPGFWDLVEVSEGRPILASHSNSRAVCGHTRNLTDRQFQAVKDSGGVVGINLFTAFVGGDGGMDALLAHFEHFLELGGEEVLALGSDWDGDITGAGGISGVEQMDRLAEAMDRRNYGEQLIRAIFYGNLARLLKL